MSLINDMLRDLEQRRRREQRSMPGAALPVAVAGQRWYGRLLLGGAGLLLLAGAAVLGSRYLSPEAPQVPVVGVSSGSVEQFADGGLAGLSRGTPVSPAAPAEPDRQQPGRIAANTKEAAPPLTTAVEEPARLFAMQVDEGSDRTRLVLDFAHVPEYRILHSGNPGDALQIIFADALIGSQFAVPELRGSLIRGVGLQPRPEDLTLAVDLLPQTTLEGVSSSGADALHERLILEFVARRTEEDTPPVTPERTHKPEASGQATAGTAAARKRPLAAGQPAVKTTAVQTGKERPGTDPPSAPRVTKAHERSGRPQQIYQRGLALRANGASSAAAEEFSLALKLQPDFVAARLQLVELVGQRDLSRARDLLREGLALNSTDPGLRKEYARLLLQQGQPAEALALLRAQPLPEISRDLEYHALLAALLRESEQYQAAAGVYGQLLNQRADQPVWWLGLALSREQAGSLEGAAAAYRRAQQVPGLSADLQNFVAGRLQLLAAKGI